MRTSVTRGTVRTTTVATTVRTTGTAAGMRPAAGNGSGHVVGAGGPAVWWAATSMTAWCATCGTDVEFAAPAGFAPADLAADERACVWCGEALVVSLGLVGGHADPDRGPAPQLGSQPA